MAKKLPRLLKLKKVAKMLQVHPETLRRWDRKGKLKAVRIGSRRGVGDRRYRVEDIEDYLRKRTIKRDFIEKYKV